MRRSAPLLVATILLAGCAAPTGSPTVAATASHPAGAAASAPGLPLLSEVDATPALRTEAGIAMAFDAEGAAVLAEVATTIDFGSRALVCVYLGQRPTGGWGLSLTSAMLRDGTLEISARETRPGGGAPQETTYPADCALLDRAALPVGSLAVRADDTISEEFIIDGEVGVPPADGAP